MKFFKFNAIIYPKERLVAMGFSAEGSRVYQSGECVVYGVHGVCRVIGKEKQLVNRKRTEYLVLEPIGHGESRFYLPVANETAMGKLRPVLTREALCALLDSEEIREDNWIADENLRKQYYRELITSGDRRELMRMVHTLYGYRVAQQTAGKKFHLCDDNFLRDAEKLLASEISLVLDKSQEDARQYLREQLA